MEKYELQKLRDLPIEGVAERLGLSITRHKSLCPFHDDHHASMTYCVRRNTCRCFVCMNRSVGTIDLVMRRLNLDFREACQWLADGNNIILEEYRPKTPARQRTNEFNASRFERFFLRPTLSEKARTFLFMERRLDPRVIAWCRIGSWTDRNGVQWLQTPYYGPTRELIGIQNRRLTATDDGTPRFRFPTGSRCSIYNLPVISLLKHGDDLWITEGCSDCWAMLSSGRKAIAIPSGTLLLPTDRQMLTAIATSLKLQFHMAPDRDEPGERLFLQLKEILPGLQHHCLPEGCKDYAEYYARQNTVHTPGKHPV